MTDFSNPPTPTGRRTKYAGFVADLKARPNQWARLPYTGKHPSTAASQIRHGNGAYKDFEPREEFEVRQTQGEIYVRHVPTGSHVTLPDREMLVKFYELVEELTYKDERPYDDVEAEVDLLQEEITSRFGEGALDRSADHFVATKASHEDMVRMAREDTDTLIRIMKGEPR
jgi:hypothetical protein